MHLMTIEKINCLNLLIDILILDQVTYRDRFTIANFTNIDYSRIRYELLELNIDIPLQTIKDCHNFKRQRFKLKKLGKIQYE